MFGMCDCLHCWRYGFTTCWSHDAISSLGDRIKIAQNTSVPNIYLSIQYILNCTSGISGFWYGGSASGVYELVKYVGYVPHSSCIPYLTCSSDRNEGFWSSVDTICSEINTCRTFNTFSEEGGKYV